MGRFEGCHPFSLIDWQAQVAASIVRLCAPWLKLCFGHSSNLLGLMKYQPNPGLKRKHDQNLWCKKEVLEFYQDHDALVWNHCSVTGRATQQEASRLQERVADGCWFCRDMFSCGILEAKFQTSRIGWHKGKGLRFVAASQTNPRGSGLLCFSHPHASSFQ